MSAQTKDLLMAMSIMASAEDLFRNYTDNIGAKDQGKTFFAILLTITAEEFDQGQITRTVDEEDQPFFVNDVISRAHAAIVGCEKPLRLKFEAHLKKFIDALVHGDKHELVVRWREDLRRAFIDAFGDDRARDQEQIRGAFDTFAQLLRMLRVRSSAETAEQMTDAEKRLKEMYSNIAGIASPEKQKTEEEQQQ